MATLRLNKDDLEMLLDNTDLADDIADKIFTEARDDFWADILLGAMAENKAVVADAIEETVKEYLDRELEHLVQKAITEEVDNAIRETINDKLDILLAKKR